MSFEACGVNRMDSELVKGEYGGLDLAEFWFGDVDLFPHIPGIEPAGVVESIDDDVSAVSKGDRVVVHSQFTCGECRWCRRGLDSACAVIAVLGFQKPRVVASPRLLSSPKRTSSRSWSGYHSSTRRRPASSSAPIGGCSNGSY